MIKSFIKKMLPLFIIEQHRKVKRERQRVANKNSSVEKVFTDIYLNNKWGGAKGEFKSGSGSVDQTIVSRYVTMIYDMADSEGFRGLNFVDLGCGDFNIGQQLVALCAHYTGVDIVKPLVIRNQELFGNQHINFLHLNILDDDLPDGDVCFVRQVLQHLSNQQIGTLLAKLNKYKWVFITEHYPTDNDAIVPNKDKVHGGDIRIYDNSGVYLTLSPFQLSQSALCMVLDVPGSAVASGDRGVIRTFLYKPAST
jgi:SAM-dependent methyltransferase